MIVDIEKAKKHIPKPFVYSFLTKDAIIYALGIGTSVQDGLHFIYENHLNFQVFPTFVVVPGLLANTSSLSEWPGIGLDSSKILHGEQYIELFDSLPTEGGDLRTEVRVLDVLDKGTGAVIVTETTTFNHNTNKLIAKQRFGLFLLGSGNFGGSRTSLAEEKAPAVPNFPPDLVMQYRIGDDQAALYRIGSGDLNPLHIDQNFAQIFGFAKPILHGLCSLGISTRLILQEYGSNDADNLRSVRARFSSPVVPGQTLLTEAWMDRGTPSGIHFQSKVLETGNIVISSGYILLKNGISRHRLEDNRKLSKI